MKLSSFDFYLPEELIALRPAYPRSSSRMLVFKNETIYDRNVIALPDELSPGDRLVINNTKVIPASLRGIRIRNVQDRKSDQLSKIYVNLDQQQDDHTWSALARPLKRLKQDDIINFSNQLTARVVQIEKNFCFLEFEEDFNELIVRLHDVGEVPLPHYISTRRPLEQSDIDDYQSVFAETPGAVAAPTASLHFDECLLDLLKQRGIKISQVTLHVGAGTFLPVMTKDISEHKMHSEWGSVSQQTATEINTTKKMGGRIIPVGTTALRLLESATNGGYVHQWSGNTNLFIKPGYQFSIVNGLVTNFHMPRTTLVILVAAFVGNKQMFRIYKHAIGQKYRFLSYGDCSLLLP